MKISLMLKDSAGAIEQSILKIIASEISLIFNKSSNNILLNIKDNIRRSILQQPEYSSLKNGKLRYDFGIPDTNSVDKVIDEILDTTNIQIKPIKILRNGLSGGIIITFLNDNDLLNITESTNASVQDSSGYSIPWLKWLLYEGVKPIIKGYSVKLGPNKNSRTGMAVMIESNSNWSVDAQFAGTKTNNWIIRAINDISDDNMSSIIQNEIEKNI